MQTCHWRVEHDTVSWNQMRCAAEERFLWEGQGHNNATTPKLELDSDYKIRNPTPAFVYRHGGTAEDMLATLYCVALCEEPKVQVLISEDCCNTLRHLVHLFDIVPDSPVMSMTKTEINQILTAWQSLAEWG